MLFSIKNLQWPLSVDPTLDSGPNINSDPNFDNGPNFDSRPWLRQWILNLTVDPSFDSEP